MMSKSQGSMMPQGQAPQAPKQKQQASPGQDAVGMIAQGLTDLKALMQDAGKAVAPDDLKLLASIKNSFQQLISELGKAPGAPSEQSPQPQGPMPANASRGSIPVNY